MDKKISVTTSLFYDFGHMIFIYDMMYPPYIFYYVIVISIFFFQKWWGRSFFHPRVRKNVYGGALGSQNVAIATFCSPHEYELADNEI